MASKLQIWNLALVNVQQSPSIQGENEDSTEANLCRVYYDEARKQMLERHDWNFARKRLTLAEVPDGPDDWAYQYGYPVDCLQARAIVKGSPAYPEIPFEVSVDPDDGLIGSADTKVIWTNQPEAQLRYTYNQKDPSFFSQSYVICLSWALAAFIAFPLTGKKATKVDAQQEAERQLLIAKATNMNEGRDNKDDRKVNEFTEAH